MEQTAHSVTLYQKQICLCVYSMTIYSFNFYFSVGFVFSGSLLHENNLLIGVRSLLVLRQQCVLLKTSNFCFQPRVCSLQMLDERGWCQRLVRDFKSCVVLFRRIFFTLVFVLTREIHDSPSLPLANQFSSFGGRI